MANARMRSPARSESMVTMTPINSRHQPIGTFLAVDSRDARSQASDGQPAPQCRAGAPHQCDLVSASPAHPERRREARHGVAGVLGALCPTRIKRRYYASWAP